MLVPKSSCWLVSSSTTLLATGDSIAKLAAAPNTWLSETSK
ncbi:MAG: hypothetical protein V7K96_01615 [Nostoc sp.]